MFEKNLRIAELLDQYEAVLTPRHRQLLDFYYNQDLSLGEIASEIGISRQGARDGIKKAEEELLSLENALGLLKKEEAIRQAAGKLLAKDAGEPVKTAVQTLLAAAEISID